MANPILTEKSLRIFLSDLPESNTLVNGVMWNSEDISEAAELIVDYYNTTNPPSRNSYTIETFPYRYIMLLGVSAHLLRGEAVNQAVNEFTYTADGVSVTDKNKAAIFKQLGDQFWEEFKQMVTDVKVTQNIASVYATKNSEYIYRVR